MNLFTLEKQFMKLMT